MITLTWHFIVFLCIEAILIFNAMLAAHTSGEGFLSGLAAVPWLFVAFVLFIVYGGGFLW